MSMSGVGYGRRSSADEVTDGRGHRYGAGGRNGRGRPRERDQRHHDRNRGSRGEVGMKAPIILARKEPQIMPGAVSIMQRESSGSRLPNTSTPIRSITSPGALVTMDNITSHPGVSQVRV